MPNSSDDVPSQAPYARHVFVCIGQYCDPQRRSPGIYRALGEKLGDLTQYDNPERVKRGITSCLGVCWGGPLMVVYPDGVWYHHVDEQALERIVEEHLRGGKPVEEYLFHRLEQPADGSGDPAA